MSKVDELVDLVRKTSDRVSAVERTIVDMGKVRTEATDVIRKALSDGRGGMVATIGFDGADQLGLLRTCIGTRQKALGMGRFLQAVHAAASGKDLAQVEKALDRMGSTPITKASLAEGSGATGGYTVPVQFYADLMRIVAEESFAKQLCTTIPMTSRSILVPALDMSTTPAAGTSAFFGGIAASWQPEAASINESEPTFQSIELVARDLVFHTVASNQLLADNAVALDTLLTTLFKEAMAWFYDYYVLRGTGVNQPLGALNSAAAFAEARSGATSVSLDDLAQMMSHLLVSSWDKAIWVMHPSVLPKLIQLTNGATNAPFLVWINPAPSGTDGPIANKLPMKLFGLPIYWTEKVPALGTKGDVMLIDLSKYLLGDRLALQIETSPHVKFLNNQMVWRIVARWDGQPWLKQTIKLADGSHQVSPFVVLE